MNNWAGIINTAATLVTIVGVIFVIQGIVKWFNAPRFVVGVLPSREEQKEECIGKLGNPSFFDELCFDKRCLARKVKGEDELDSLKYYNDSSRNAYPDKDNNIKLPIIIQNIGRSEASKYNFGISFSNSNIRITDLATESLGIDGLYTHDKSFLENKSLLSKLPRQELQNIYEDLELTRDYVSFVGSLSSRTFEAIFLKLHVPEDCKDFFIILKIDCPDFFFSRRQVYGQYINIFRTKNHQA
jgi:hypothetical protein